MTRVETVIRPVIHQMPPRSRQCLMECQNDATLPIVEGDLTREILRACDYACGLLRTRAFLGAHTPHVHVGLRGHS
jgi:hypothetical protein